MACLVLVLVDPVLIDVFKELGVPFVHLWRRNALDRYVCSVKDCFVPRTAQTYPVYHGERSELCFARRFLPGFDASQYKVHLNAQATPTRLRRFIQQTRDDRNKLINDGLVPSISPLFDYETLAAVQFPASNETGEFARSAAAWHTLQLLLGANATYDEVVACLAPLVGKYHRPALHKDTIVNYASVRSGLCHSKFDRASVCGLIRE